MIERVSWTLFFIQYIMMLHNHVSLYVDCTSGLNWSHCKKKGRGSFYIAQYPVRWTAQSASHVFAFPDRPVHSDTVLGFSGKHSSQAAITRQD